MLAREKSQREEGSQKSGGEREKERQVWPEKAEKRRETLEESRSRPGEMRKNILLERSKDVGS
jgi:hypothetical protein